MMHRAILGLEKGGPHVDHRNGDKLDNTRSNLRICTHQQNMANRKRHRHSASQFKGVYQRKNCKNALWRATIGTGQNRRRLGVFATAAEAAHAYDRAAIERYGEFACLNFPPEGFRAAG